MAVLELTCCSVCFTIPWLKSYTILYDFCPNKLVQVHIFFFLFKKSCTKQLGVCAKALNELLLELSDLAHSAGVAVAGLDYSK